VKQQDHQAERILIGFCVAAYFVSYITRINYGTVLLEIVNSEGITKMSASMAVTGSFVTYGIGQLISGWLGDRIKPRYLMFIGLMVSAGMNVCVPLFSRPAAMLVFWCINGFAQALMWPPTRIPIRKAASGSAGDLLPARSSFICLHLSALCGKAGEACFSSVQAVRSSLHLRG